MKLVALCMLLLWSSHMAYQVRFSRPFSLRATSRTNLRMAKNKGSKFITDDLIDLLKDHIDEDIVPKTVNTPVPPKVSTPPTAVIKDLPEKESLLKESAKVADDSKSPSFQRLQFGATGENRLKHVMMGLKKVTVAFGDKQVLKDASFTVSSGEKVGLVGSNGSGKTLILQTLSGDIEPDSGEVLCSSPEVAAAFLRQEFSEELSADFTVKEELFLLFPEQFGIYQQLLQLNDTIEEKRASKSPESAAASEIQYQRLHHEALQQGVFDTEARIMRILNETGFSIQDADKLVSDFSGGWKMRVGLAKIFLQEPNILFMDEPTNHLDLDSVMWLESFLVKEKIPMVIVSHDREFLNRVCNKIVDLEEGITKTYRGNYGEYLAHKKADQMAWLSRYSKQCIEVANMQSYIRKFKQEVHMSQAVANKEAALKRLTESEDFLVEPPKSRKYRFKFPEPPRSEEILIEASKLGHRFNPEGDWLFQNLDLVIRRGNRIGLVGPNGAGKSTLARIVADLEKPASGAVSHRDHRLKIGYFAQNQADALDLEKTIQDIMFEAAPEGFDRTEIRGLLGQFMFRSGDAQKKVEVLSGGEKARVALCKMLLQPANLLILDEPTNHLDITSKEALEDALVHYTGALIVISHDRYFMSQVANSIISFSAGKAQQYECDYYDYLYKQNGIAEEMKDVMQSRKVAGNFQELTSAPAVVVPKVDEKKKKNFGGSGVTCGNLNKGIKNAKRFN